MTTLKARLSEGDPAAGAGLSAERRAGDAAGGRGRGGRADGGAGVVGSVARGRGAHRR